MAGPTTGPTTGDLPIVVVGAGVAGVRFVRRLRRAGYAGALVLLDAQHGEPYDRPPLSKQVLRGERDRPVLLDAPALADLGVDWRPGCRAVGLDAVRRAVLLEGGGEVSYSSLVIASGARARRVPGLHGHVLRTCDDALALRAGAGTGRVALVVGAGVVGCEVAASLRQLGSEVHLVDTLSAPMVRVMGPALASLVTALHLRNGVALHLGTRIDQVVGGVVTLADGTRVDPDLTVEAIGTEPELGWLEGSGLEVNNGIVCAADQSTSLPDVYAVGDAVSFDGRRSEHWTAATNHADRAVATILGSRVPGPEPAYWWSDQYDVKLQGLGEVADADELVLGRPREGEGDLGLLGRRGRLVGVVGAGAPASVMRLRAAALAGESLVTASAALRDASWQGADGAEPTAGTARFYREALLSTVAGGAA